MKLFKSLLLILLIIGTLNSCEKEELEVTVIIKNDTLNVHKNDTLNVQKTLQENILGVWKSDAYKMLNNGEITRYNYVAFNENGICTFWQADYENDSLRSIEDTKYYNWYANGNKGISIYINGSSALDTYYITINGDKMSVNTGFIETSQYYPFYIDTDNGISTWNRQN